MKFSDFKTYQDLHDMIELVNQPCALGWSYDGDDVHYIFKETSVLNFKEYNITTTDDLKRWFDCCQDDELDTILFIDEKYYIREIIVSKEPIVGAPIILLIVYNPTH